MFFLWGLLMTLVGVVVGWLLRSLRSRFRSGDSESRTGSTTTAAGAAQADGTDVAELQARVAELEPVVAERDRLRMELADVRGSSVGALGFASPHEPPIIPAEPADHDGGVDPLTNHTEG